MKLPTLLLIDDDREFMKAQTVALQNHFHIVPAEGVHSSLNILQRKNVDCVLVDYYLADGNGHDVASWVAKNMPWCPVLLVSGYMDKKIAVDSFSHRIFDILEKPYGLDAALAKLNLAVIESKNRKKDPTAPPGAAETEWSLDKERRAICYGDQRVVLTSTEVKILEVLIESANKVVPRNTLIKAIWNSMTVAENTLDTHLTNLRKKAPFLKECIKGVRGVGYVFEP